ncbi:MAG: hypothetical protein F6J98_29325 [Moorea sp. SIO4G2]|uniref:hypothetical protein n=1 Tax=Moorena TaxID=1155738 RepID=UPI0011807B2C|nr:MULTISPECIES: hypothetical protein [Moorena]NEO24945.1 hypothetical protein [Moorena sp. SIO4A5]NEO64290.1 hypothetical protein [Moorena sp. SIO4G2]
MTLGSVSPHPQDRYHSNPRNAIKKNSRLYNALKTWISQPCEWAHLSHHFHLFMDGGSPDSDRGSEASPDGFPFVPCRGQYAQSKQRRMHRWLPFCPNQCPWPIGHATRTMVQTFD